ncbi:MAG: bacterial transcriptional activator domain-containing protein [Alphaproteobacteria bacterium]|nr:bacterial transcriptional activator domain-containing protein [Alphaproteobacteria bacterium]
MTSIQPSLRKALLGASVPRSGHHYLQRILCLYFGMDMHYCEWYGPPDCCRQVPCTRIGYRVTYQKSHDWDFALRQDVPDGLYLIQYRHPVPEALSDRDLMRDSIAGPSFNYRLTRDHYGWWLAAKAIYFRKFHQKWFERRLPNAIYVNYEALTQEPANTIAPIIEWVDGSVDLERLSGAIAEASPSRSAATEVYKPRVIEDSAHFDRDLLAAFEAYVLHHCPKLEFESILSGSYEDHWLNGLILIQDTDLNPPEGEDRLDAAARLAPQHPEITTRVARRELDRGAAEKAIGLLEETIERNPYFGGAYRLMVDACKAAGKPLPPSVTNANALFACSETPGALTEIARAMVDDERLVNAVAALSFNCVIQPDNFRAHHILARTLIRLGRWAEARRHAERAARLKPEHEANNKLIANIRDHLGIG